jgi:hypothetical protein
MDAHNSPILGYRYSLVPLNVFSKIQFLPCRQEGYQKTIIIDMKNISKTNKE